MNPNKIYDIIGIGIGPFNLGLAALCKNMNELDTLFIDKNQSFNWHPGLMLPTAKMQVPFYADLVTLADPTSAFSYMNYLKQSGRLFRFAINESYFPYRSEYNEYCKWVISRLNNLHFGTTCENILYDKKERIYTIIVQQNGEALILKAKHIVIGIGSAPYVPRCIQHIEDPHIFHSANYLPHKNVALMKKDITIIGSGQSAAEIFHDLLPYLNNLRSLKWYSRSSRIFAMDYSKFALEFSSPEYIHYFYHLPRYKKLKILSEQHDLYKGINLSLIEAIYEQLYILSLDQHNNLPLIRNGCELISAEKTSPDHFTLQFKHKETDKTFAETTQSLILATGYRSAIPNFCIGISGQINSDKQGQYIVNENYSVDNNNSIFVQNAEWHTHGFNSADLGLGPHRNLVIINTILQHDYFKVPKENTFQVF